MSQPFVSVEIIGPNGIVGEDHRDWLAGETHQASPAYAAYLVRRGVARMIGEIGEAGEMGDAAAALRSPSNRMRQPGRAR